MEMQPLIDAVCTKMTELLRHPVLYKANVTTDTIWEAYQNAIPEEHNPIFLERRVYECDYCERFITRAGRIQFIKDDLTIDTVWNVQVSDPVLQHIADTLHELVSTADVNDLFSHPLSDMMDHIKQKHTYWIPRNQRLLTPEQGGNVVEFNHFHGPEEVPVEHLHNDGSIGHHFMSSAQVFSRALREITVDAIETVIDLIEDDALYRAPDIARMRDFLRYKQEYLATPEDKADLYVWRILQGKISDSITHIRNTSFGTLLVDISEDMDLEQAVTKYRAIVDPTNYKRSKSVVTKKMVETARAKVQELGLLPSFDRRHATLDDLPVSELMFVDRNVATTKVNDDIFDSIDELKATDNHRGAQVISIAQFISDVLPTAKSMEVRTDKGNASHLFNLTTAVDPSAKPLFKWPNSFGWNYNGDVAASIRERVKQAGGVVDADICVRLAWEYDDDLDLMLYAGEVSNIHKERPLVFFGSKRNAHWELDVDANAHGRTMEYPVENMFAMNKRHLVEGKYTFVVNNYCERDTTASGFAIEIAIQGEPTITLTYDGPTPDKHHWRVCTLEIDRLGNAKVHIDPCMTKQHRTYVENGITYGDFNPVLAMSTSPNYWDEKTLGHKHYFFFLKGYRTDENIRVFYNEFLHDDLHDHRKVMEVLGGKTKIAPSEQQLGGMGYMVGENEVLTVRVQTDNGPRIYNVKF